MKTIPINVSMYDTQTRQVSHKDSQLAIVPAPSGTCPQCACKHEEGMPHNRDSLHYQYSFFADHQRWPTWADAMSHCSDEAKELLVGFLANHGINAHGEEK
jgi:hypothetical protein